MGLFPLKRDYPERDIQQNQLYEQDTEIVTTVHETQARLSEMSSHQ